MIDPMPTKVDWDEGEILKIFPYITVTDRGDTDITINKPQEGKYNISYNPLVDLKDIDEIWVDTIEIEIKGKRSGIKLPIIILTTDKDLLPYCIKDRLVYLQDKINKEKGRYGNNQ